MTSAQLVPAIIIPLLAWRVYLRVRRSIGRQHFRPARLVTSIVVFSVFSIGIGLAAWTDSPSVAALGGGLLLGLPLALVALHLTRFEAGPDGKYYTPNTAIGVAVTVLFVGRIGYRAVVLFLAPPAESAPPPALFHSPLTMVLYGVTAGYYIAYFAGVLVRGKKTP